MGLLTLGCQVDIFVTIFFFLGSEKESSVSNAHCTEVRFASFLSSGFDTMAVINPPEMKLVLHTSVQCIVHEALRAHSKFVRRFNTGKSLSEALIFTSINPQYDNRLFMELP